MDAYLTGGHVDVAVEDGRIIGVDGGSGGCGHGPIQACHDLVVGGLGEVSVPHPDAVERFGCLGAHQLVGGAGQVHRPARRGDRNGQDHTRGSVGPGHLTGRPSRRTSGDPVVHHDHRSALERDPRPPPTEPLGPARQLGSFPPLHHGELRRAHPGGADQIVVDDSDAVLTDGAHPQLRLERHAQLAHEDHVQRSVERLGDLERRPGPRPEEAPRPRRPCRAGA